MPVIVCHYMTEKIITSLWLAESRQISRYFLIHIAEQVNAPSFVTFSASNKYMLFTGRQVRIGKDCARGLEYDPRLQAGYCLLTIKENKWKLE